MSDTSLLGTPAAEPAVGETVDTAPAVDTKTQAPSTLLGGTEEPAVDAAPKGAAEDEAKPEDGEETKASGAPEEYGDFQVTEGVELHPEVLSDFKVLAKELNMPQEAAQRLVDLGTALALKASEQAQVQLQATTAQWAEDTKADTEIGGDKLQASLAVANKALSTFASPGLREMLDGGLGNHPEVIRLFVKIGNAIGEDRLVTSGGGEATEKREPGSKLYPNQ